MCPLLLSALGKYLVQTHVDAMHAASMSMSLHVLWSYFGEFCFLCFLHPLWTVPTFWLLFCNIPCAPEGAKMKIYSIGLSVLNLYTSLCDFWLLVSVYESVVTNAWALLYVKAYSLFWFEFHLLGICVYAYGMWMCVNLFKPLIHS